MITLKHCLEACSIPEAALLISNKIAFDRSRGFAQSLDTKTYWEYAGNLDFRLSKLTRIIDKYQFSPTKKKLRRIGWKDRILYISTWEDKIVEVWLSKALNRLLDKWFSSQSYAYRAGKVGVDLCQRHVVVAVRDSKFMARRDITAFFYSIDHNLMLDKISSIVEQNDPLFELLRQRVQFSYVEAEQERQATVGLPFGSPLACLLANAYLTDLDKKLKRENVHYFRYADDFLLTAATPEPVLQAVAKLQNGLESLRLKLNPDKLCNVSFVPHPDFVLVNRFKYLGLEYRNNGIIRLPLEKRRKIMGIFRRALNNASNKIKKQKSLDEKLIIAVESIKEAVMQRIRYAAIIDYYLKHVDDEEQLRQMDRELAELVIGAVLNKKFKKRDFKTIPFKKLRAVGLLSLVHRRRLHRHGHLKIPFLSLFNRIMLERHELMLDRRAERFNSIRLARKIQKEPK